MGAAIHRRPARAAALAVVVAIVLAGLQALPAGAEPGRPSDLVEACAGAPTAEDTFTDRGTRDGRERQVIDCLASGYRGHGSATDFVLQGSGGRVNFDGTISRAQFAAILNRVADHLGVPAHGTPTNGTFADVPRAHAFFGEIEELAARGLTNGAGADVDDLDDDGDTDEAIYNPTGTVSYGQVLAFVHRLLASPSAVDLDLAANRSNGQANELDCAFFDPEKAKLDNAGFLLAVNIPGDCRDASPRGLVFDLIAVALDEAVEQQVVDNPHRIGTLALAVDRASAFVHESITATLTITNRAGGPVVGQAVEVFVVNAADPFDSEGNPRPDAAIDVGGTGRHGTGAVAARIDADDPVTGDDGTVSVRIFRGADAPGSFRIHAFVGDEQTSWLDVRETGDATPGTPVTWTGRPVDILVSSDASRTDTLRYGSAYVVSFQLVDEAGNAVPRSGMRVDAWLEHRDSCADVANTAQRCQGDVVESTILGLTTNAEGRAGATVFAPTDPDTANGPSFDGVDGGDESSTTIGATMPAQQGLPALASAVPYVMRFLDASPGGVDVATWEFSESSSPNPNRLDEAGRDQSHGAELRVRTTDHYGSPVGGVAVRVRSDQVLGTGDQIIRTDASGTAVHAIAPLNSPGDRSFTALVNADRSTGAGGAPTFGGFGDLDARTPTGGTQLTVHWLGRPSAQQATTYTDQDIVGHSTTGLSVDLHGAHVRVWFEPRDTYTITGIESATMSDFLDALEGDVGSNDRLRLVHSPNGISEWTLTVNAASGPVQTP